MTLRIATRGSMLALWQANHVRDRLMANEPGLEVELVVIKTRGDKIIDRPLAEVGGKGLFVKEIEEALLDGRADIAVHSLKDLPAEVPDALVIAAIPEREDPRDALVLPRGKTGGLESLAKGARVGTSSLRRVCQLKAKRPDLVIEPLRGNVDTRIKKLDAGELDAIVLACAGLRRLGHGDRITQAIDISESLPAIGQGALAIECRGDDEQTRHRLTALDHPPTHRSVAAERGFLARLEGGCQTPMAAHATLAGDRLTLDGLVGAVDGSEILRATLSGSAHDATSIGVHLAEELLSRGAARLLHGR
jgi:hydroxymethylbilane synthase